MPVLVSRVILPVDDVYFVFIWLVIPVIVSVAHTETTVVCPFWSWLGCFIFEITYCFILYLGRGAVSPCYNEF